MRRLAFSQKKRDSLSMKSGENTRDTGPLLLNTTLHEP